MSLTRKLVFAFLVVSTIGALLAIVLARWMTVQEFNRLVIEQAQTAFIERAAAYYANNGSWSGVPLHFRQSPRPPYEQQTRSIFGKTPQKPTFAFTLVDQDGFVIIPGGNFKMRQHIPEETLLEGQLVLVNGGTVGTVIASGEPPQLIPLEERYLERTNRALILAASGAALVALILGFILARGLTGPLRELTEAIRTLARGELGGQVPVRTQDEIGDLAMAFNQMSSELERLTHQRKQMTADIAHELRTPLTVIRGYIESMQEHVLDITPERLETINREVRSLDLLVEDLRTLSLAEAGQLSLNPIWGSPQTLLEQVQNAYKVVAAKKGITLTLLENTDLPEIQVDPDRMMQVLSNLVTNALRHTPAGGTINLQSGISREPLQVNSSWSAVVDQPTTETWLTISIADSGEGIHPDVLKHIFDRFYQGDPARQDGGAESGLGLTIASSIVSMHRGHIMAYSEGPGKGSTFTIYLPINDPPSR